MTESNALVLDSGSGTTKGGFAGDDTPCAVIPSVVGRVRQPDLMTQYDKDAYVGSDAQERRGVLRLNCPFRNGQVVNWMDLEQIWSYTFETMKVDPNTSPVVLADTPTSTNADRERMSQIMFETFDVPGLYIDTHSVLSLYSCGQTTGCIVECGASTTSVVAVHDGYPLHKMQTSVAGSMVTSYLMQLLVDAGNTFTTAAHRELVRDIKETRTEISLNYSQDIKVEYNDTYTLPDGKVITLDSKAICSPEILFSPSLANVHQVGVHELTHNAIMKCTDEGVRRDLFSNIILSGGSTMFTNFKSRLAKELRNMLPSNYNIGIYAPPERNYSAWRGGSLLGTLLKDMRDFWITKEQYDEVGPSIAYLRRT